MDEKRLLERIVVDPEIMVGKPTVKGTRITVQLVLRLLAQGLAVKEILEEYPHISKEDIAACLIFASKALDDAPFLSFSL